MFKKTLIALGLLGMTGLAGCVVAGPHHHFRAAYYGPGPVVIAPSFGYYGAYGYRGYYGYGGHRHWR